MKKITAIILAIVMVIGIVALVGFCVVNIAQNGFHIGAIPAMAGAGIVGLFTAIKSMRKA